MMLFRHNCALPFYCNQHARGEKRDCNYEVHRVESPCVDQDLIIFFHPNRKKKNTNVSFKNSYIFSGRCWGKFSKL